MGDTQKTILIIALILAGVAILIAAYFLLDKFFFSRLKCKKILSALERKYEYLHALLTGQDFQYVQRIEVISRTNLLYTDVYAENYKRYKDIREDQEVHYQEALNTLVQYLDKTDIKGFKKYYRDATPVFLSYEEAVNNFNNLLMNVIKPEEESRQNSLILKEEFREVKSKYNLIEDQLAFVVPTFEKIFKTIDERFDKFEDLVEEASYDQANEMLPEIQNVLKACANLIEKVPEIIRRTNEVVPQELNDAIVRFNDLTVKEFQLKHVGFERIRNSIETELEAIKADLSKLAIKEIPDKLDRIEAEIVEVNKLFQEEENAAEEFNTNSERIYGEFGDISADFIKVRNAMPRYQSYYLINRLHAEELRGIQLELDQVGQDKRRLDMYVHSAEKTAYTTLVVKMRELEEGTHHLVSRFNNYKEFLSSLKVDSEKAFTEINKIYFKLKENEQILRGFFNEDFEEKFINDFDKCYEMVDSIYAILKKKPIDVDSTNSMINELEERSSLLFNRIGDANEFREKSLEEIGFMNRARVKFADVNVQLNQAENLFLNGEYARCFQMTDEIRQRLQEKDNAQK